MKLSKTQKKVIELMKKGYELKCTGFDHKRVQSNTIESLKNLKLITFQTDSIMRYRLTPFGELIKL